MERTESERAVAKVLEEIATEVSAPCIQAGEPHVYPILWNNVDATFASKWQSHT